MSWFELFSNQTNFNRYGESICSPAVDALEAFVAILVEVKQRAIPAPWAVYGGHMAMTGGVECHSGRGVAVF